MQRGRGRTSTFVAIVGVGLVAAATAAGAPCHPDSPGTRTLAVTGHVEGYAQRGAAVRLVVRTKSGCRETAVWRPLVGKPVQKLAAERVMCGRTPAPSLGHSVELHEAPKLPLRAVDGARRAELGIDGLIRIYRGDVRVRQIARVARARALKVALSGDRVVVLAEGAYRPDRPFRLEVYSTRTGKALHDWPLLARPTTLDLYGNVALFSARNSGGLFGLRLSDGKTTLFSPVQPGDRPQINRYGVVFQSNLYERFNRQGRVFMKFLPTTVVRGDFEKTFDTLEMRWPIKAFAMDGPRVAVMLDAPGRTCDPVRFWNVPWHSFVRINMIEDLTCAHGMQMGAALAIAGIGAEWVATKAGTPRIIVSDSKACIEDVAGTIRTATTPPLAGDGLLLAFGGPAGSSLERGAVALVNWKTKRRVIVPTLSPARALSLDQDRLAVLGADRRVAIFASDGARIATLETATPRAIALRGHEVVVATRAGTLEVWDVSTGRRTHAWRLPRGTSPSIDVHFGIAVFSAGRTVYALRLDTGRVVALSRAPRPSKVQIEASGVVYQYNAGGRSFMKFIPLAAVEHALGLD